MIIMLCMTVGELERHKKQIISWVQIERLLFGWSKSSTKNWAQGERWEQEMSHIFGQKHFFDSHVDELLSNGSSPIINDRENDLKVPKKRKFSTKEHMTPKKKEIATKP